MRFSIVALSLAIMVLMGAQAQARVFDINDQTLGAYLRGSYFPNATENTAFSKSNGSNLTVNNELKSIQSGEFGFTYATSGMNLRFGFEVIRPPTITGTAVNGSGTDMYDINSQVSVYAPKIAAEFNLVRWEQARFFFNLGVGAATLTARNSYTMTAAGTTALGVTDFAEELHGTAILYDGNFGIETSIGDTTTFILEGGYRSLNFTELKHNKDNSVIGPQAVVKGDTAKNGDGTNRTLDLSNMYLGAMFRFWFR